MKRKVILKFTALILAGAFLLSGCASTTIINSSPNGAKIYIDGEPLLFLDGRQEVFGEQDELFSLFPLQQVVHGRGKRAGIPHSEIVADGIHVMMGHRIVDVDGGG